MNKTDKNEKRETTLVMKLKKFFNHPAPLVIVLIAFCAFLLIYISKNTSRNEIYVGEIIENDIQIPNIHYFTNGDMNYFYSSPAEYYGEKKKIYSYQIGYFGVTDDNEYIEFVSKTGNLEKAVSLDEIVREVSGWNFAESAHSRYFFDNKVIPYMGKLHFIIRASTKKNETNADVVIDYQISASKITK